MPVFMWCILVLSLVALVHIYLRLSEDRPFWVGDITKLIGWGAVISTFFSGLGWMLGALL